MPRDRLSQALTTTLLAIAVMAPAAAAELGVSEGTGIAVDATPDGRHLVFDLYGRLWRIPRSGGMAEPLTGPELRLTRPDVGPDGRIVAEGDDGTGPRIWILGPDGRPESLTAGGARDAAPRWHPSGERVIFASDRAGSWDIWEIRPADREAKRLTDATTDETEPAVSAGGERLAWITRTQDLWELWTRLAEGAPRLLYTSHYRLSAPSIRPDDSVVLVVEDTPDGARHTAVILSEPPVAKPVVTGQDLFRAPVAWLDRNRLVYTADGGIRLRGFGELRSRRIPWTAWISVAGPPEAEAGLDGSSALLHHGRYVIRAGRVFDGVNPDYRRDLDILVEDDRIAAVTDRREWQDTAVLEYPDAVVIPGLIQLGLPGQASPDDGALLLGCGVTTVVELPVSPDAPGASLPDWNDGTLPGPVLLSGRSPAGGLVDVRNVSGRAARIERIRAARAAGAAVITDRLYPDLAAGASLLAGDARLPVSPAGRRYADVGRLLEASGTRLVAGGASDGYRDEGTDDRREGSPESLPGDAGQAAAPHAGPDIACPLDRHVRGFDDADAPPAEILRRYTAEQARFLGLESERGVVAAGARADLVLVDGDPLADAGNALSVRAVIAGGRFFTPAGLLADRKTAGRGETSENLTTRPDSEEMSPNRDSVDIMLTVPPRTPR